MPVSLTSYGVRLMRNTLFDPVLTPTLASFVTGEAIAPLWVSPSGRAFFPIAGGAPDDPPPADPPPAEPPKPTPPPSDPPKFEPINSQEEFDRRLSGRLAREKDKYADYDDLKAAKVEYDKLLEAAKSDQEKAVDAARKEGEAAATERTNAILVAAKAETLAATARFHNPETAVKLLDLTSIKVTDGVVDSAAVKTALDKLATDQPFLIDTTKPGPRPDPSQAPPSDPSDASVSSGRDRYRERHGKKTT